MRRKWVGVQRRGASTFRINYRDAAGVRHYETVECESEEEAENVRKVRIGDVAAGKPVSSKPNTVIFEELAADVVNDYIANGYDTTPDIDARFRLHLNPVFGRRKAAQITTADFRSYTVRRMEEGAKAATINRELDAARHAYLLAMQSSPPKVLLRPHIPRLKENNVRKGFFERPAFEAICRHLPKHLVGIATVGYITGWRHEEITNLRVRHVHLDAGELRLEPGETKNDEGRTFPMARSNSVGDELRAVLEAAIAKREHPFPEDRVFTRAGEPINRFDKAWTTACRKAGLPIRFVPLRRARRDETGGLRRDEFRRLLLEPAVYKRGKKKGELMYTQRASVYFHDFRRTAYRNLVRSGVPEKIARAAVGWKDAKTAERYNIVAAADLEILREKRLTRSH